MKLSDLNGKTILSAKQMKVKDYEDDGFVFIEFTDQTKVLIVADYNESYPQNSYREYATQMLLKDELTMVDMMIDLEEKETGVSIPYFGGWIKCTTDVPPDNVDVMVTDGADVWIGDYSRKRREKDGRWSLVYAGAIPFDPQNVIAWKLKPTVPANLRS